MSVRIVPPSESICYERPIGDQERGMSLDGTYDHDNIFAKIVRGEMAAVKVFEDDDVLAFMDVFPQARGHTLVIPKRSTARNLLEEQPQNLAAVTAAVQRVARAVRAALNPDGIVVTQFNGAPAGQTIFHLHFHVIPRWDGEALGRHGSGGMADMTELRALAEQIAAKLD
jgi:histidine triad (HIT) family protein